jgi:predicted metal-dependent phosphotriesterase family hydrolase
MISATTLATVSTTAGKMDAGELGLVLPHEHVMICSPDVRQVWPESFDAAAAFERCVARLSAARRAGVDLLVDVTTIDFGRDAAFIERVAMRLSCPWPSAPASGTFRSSFSTSRSKPPSGSL